MNITFMFGNGFDIGLGMPTKFEHFYNEYCKNIDSSNDNIRCFKTTLKEWLESTDKEKKVVDWADFEKTFGKHSLDFEVNEKREYLERFQDFVSSFNLYLENVEKCTNLENISAITKVINEALKNYKAIRKEDADEIEAFYRRFGLNRLYNFVSFNYTKTVDAFYNALKVHLGRDSNRGVGNLVHIHGYIEDSMIVGVNDSSQILKEEFSEDPEVIDTLVKPRQNTTSRTGHEKELRSVIDSSHVICVYGMSIGDTDKKWWDYISNWLAGHESRILVILQYESKYSPKLPYIQSNFTKPILEKFLGFSSLPDDKKQKIIERIYIGFNNNVFAMNLFDSEKFDKEYRLVE